MPKAAPITERPDRSKLTVVPSIARQQWLDKAQAELRRHFHKLGYTVPDAVRVTMGWPKGSHGGKKAIGQCWSEESSADKHNEIFISPELGIRNGSKKDERVAASILILATIAHEDVHATVGNAAGHKRPFKDCAVKIGLEGKMTATVPGGEFITLAKVIIEKIGEFPAGMLSPVGLKKQAARLLKCECLECGYVARVTRKWVEASGTLICPTDQVSLKCEDVDGEESEGDD